MFCIHFCTYVTPAPGQQAKTPSRQSSGNEVLGDAGQVSVSPRHCTVFPIVFHTHVHTNSGTLLICTEL